MLLIRQHSLLSIPKLYTQLTNGVRDMCLPSYDDSKSKVWNTTLTWVLTFPLHSFKKSSFCVFSQQHSGIVILKSRVAMVLTSSSCNLGIKILIADKYQRFLSYFYLYQFLLGLYWLKIWFFFSFFVAILF